LHPTEAVAPGNTKPELPFHPETEQGSATDTDHPSASNLNTSLPFRTGQHSRILPAGTLLTVNLQGSLSTPKVHAGDVFRASVAAPLAIDGDTLIQRGALVTGRVESAQSQPGRPGLVPGSGYFRLTLVTVTVEGKPIVLQTSSLFARGTVQHSAVLSNASSSHLPSDTLKVQKGRLLTFRLTAPVILGDTNSSSTGQYSN
jgi:hypothetical protein